MKNIFLALAVFCSGCGGGGSDPAPAIQKTVLIEAYGDSTTVGVGASSALNSEPVELQGILQKQLGSSVTVANLGISGTEASQLLVGWSDRMAASRANIVTINHGLNDPYYTVVLKSDAPPETPAQYADVMTQLVQIAKAAGKQVVLYEPNPTCDAITPPLLPSYVAALQMVAQQQNVPIVSQFDYIQTLPNWQSLLSDCVHPTDSLYKLKADREALVLSPLVASMMK